MRRLFPFLQRLGGSAEIGPLEARVLEELWGHAAAASVRDLLPAFPELAYTTLMTTVDRLHKKGVLSRERRGRAYLYRCLVSRQELGDGLAAEILRRLLGESAHAARPVLSTLVDAVGAHDRAMLDELERLIQAKRRALEDEP